MDIHAIRSSVAGSLEPIRALRHDLHRHPELSFHESRTSGVVQRELGAMGISFVAGLGAAQPADKGNGVLGYIPASGSPEKAPTIALRADIDALPIAEETGREYASTTPGVMHACGHDGHTSMLLGAARVIGAAATRPNNVLLIFQPAEENGAGAEKMCRDGALDGRHFPGRAGAVSAVYGLHGWPEMELGTIGIRDGAMLAATDEFRVIVHGKGGHAAQPHLTLDPIVCASALVTALQTIASRRFSPFEPVVVTVGEFHAGSANNIIPESAMLHGTIRTLTDAARTLAEQEFHQLAAQVCAAHGCRAEVIFRRGYPATRNAAEPTNRFRKIAAETVGPDRLIEREHPTMGGEDFAYYGAHAPTTFFFLGLRPKAQATYPGLHTPRFDFNDDALQTGIELMAALALSP